MIRTCASRVRGQNLAHHILLEGVFRSDAELVARGRDGVIHAQHLRHLDAYFVAPGGRNPALPLQFFPGHVDLFRADQRKNIVLPAIFPHQGGRQAQPPAGLEPGSHLEHGGRQQMHFVVNYQPPVAMVKQLKVGERVGLGPRAR